MPIKSIVRGPIANVLAPAVFWIIAIGVVFKSALDTTQGDLTTRVTELDRRFWLILCVMLLSSILSFLYAAPSRISDNALSSNEGKKRYDRRSVALSIFDGVVIIGSVYFVIQIKNELLP